MFVYILFEIPFLTAIKCPLEIPSGRLSSLCRGLVGEICALLCDDESIDSVHVVCLPSGLWDVEIGAICIPGSRSGKRLNMYCLVHSM